MLLFHPRGSILRCSPTFLGVLLFVLVCVASPASAQVNVTHRFGLWENFEGRATGGQYICGMGAKGEGKTLTIKHFQNEEGFTFQIFNPAWNVSREAEVRVAIRLGGQFNSGPLRGTAYPSRSAGVPFVEIHVNYASSYSFWQAFRWASVGYLDFLTGNEGSWRIDLTGSNAATLQYARCVERMGFSRQPFSTAPNERSASETFPSNPPSSGGGGRKSPF